MLKGIITSIVYAVFFILLYNTIGNFFPELGQELIIGISILITILGASIAMRIAKGGIYIILGLVIIQLFLLFTNESGIDQNYIIDKIQSLL